MAGSNLGTPVFPLPHHSTVWDGLTCRPPADPSVLTANVSSGLPLGVEGPLVAETVPTGLR